MSIIDFEKIDNPYDYNLNRTNSDIFSSEGQKFNNLGLPTVNINENNNSGPDQIFEAGSIPGGTSVPAKEDFWISNWIKSRSYKPKSQGFLIDGRLGYIECMKLYVGTGGIVGGSINIPNAENPQFSVDSAGNAKVYSLERNDFHWFTPFESLDGYDKTVSGVPGAISVGSGTVGLFTGSTSGDYIDFNKYLYAIPNGNITWDKDSKVTIGFSASDSVNQTIRLCRGNGSTAAAKKIGFLISNSTVYGVTADGTNYTLVQYGLFTSGGHFLTYKTRNNGKIVDFYFDNVFFGTSTTNIPTGTGVSNYIVYAYVKTDDNSSRTVNLIYWDFWQAN